MSEEKYELVKFVDNGFELEVNVSQDENTVFSEDSSSIKDIGLPEPSPVKNAVKRLAGWL